MTLKPKSYHMMACGRALITLDPKQTWGVKKIENYYIISRGCVEVIITAEEKKRWFLEC